MTLTGQTAIVTGAAQGIGKGIARELARNGVNIVVADLHLDRCQEVVHEIEREFPVRAHAVACDVSKAHDVQRLVDEAKNRFGGLDILVNNAGIFPFKPLVEMSEDEWSHVMDVNLRSIFLTCKAALPVLPDGGRIITISSIASLVGFRGLTHYCATKGGVNAFTRALALETAPRNITVNAVAPGAIKTPGAAMVDENAVKQMLAAIPLQRQGTPEDIAHAVVYLASPGAAYVTGQVITVDGGWTLQ